MNTKNIVNFSKLLDKLCSLLEKAGFEVTGIAESNLRNPVTGKFTGEFIIRILPKND